MSWLVPALILCLLASSAVIAWGMVHYRIPGSLWRRFDRVQNPVPEIPLELDYKVTRPEPALAFDRRAADTLDVWQEKGRLKLQELLGVGPQPPVPPARTIREESLGDVVRETLILTATDGQELPAFLLRQPTAGRRPGLMVIPGHSRGIVNTAGIIMDYQHANALALARAGYVTLTIEIRGFGYLGRMGASPESIDLASHVAWIAMVGETALGKTVDDVRSGLSYLQARHEVDAERLGVVGFSSGGKAAIYASALDLRIQATVASGCVGSHAANFRFSRHDSYEAAPGLANWLALSDCMGLSAPRPLLAQWGDQDTDTKARCAAFNASSLPEWLAAQQIYASANAAEMIEKHVTPGLGHEFDNASAIAFLAKHLRLTQN